MERPSKLPQHVTLIMDGNGRWAKQRGKERIYGHYEGVSSVRAVMEASVEWGIKYVSFYAFSEENWNRPDSEVSGLMDLMGKAMIHELPTFKKYNVRFLVLGNKERLSDGLKAEIEKVEAQTKDNTGLTMILFLSYSGKWDILQAVKKLVKDVVENPGKAEQIGDMQIGDFDKYLVTAGIPDPDLIVRTSGESRISNYLLWQAAYSELLFVDVLWPDFRKPEFYKALESYAKRERRYGKVK